MTKRKWSIMCASVVIAGLVLTSLVSARPGHGRFGRGGPGLFPFRVLKNVDLTDTQQANIVAIKETHQESLTSLKNGLQETRQEVLDQLLGAADVVANDFTSLQAELSQMHAALFEELLAMGLAIRAELTPAQRAEAAAIIEKFRARRAERHAEWHALKDGAP